MKRFVIPLFLICSVSLTAAQGVALNEITKKLERQLPALNAPQATKSELKYGLEGLTTWRSEYVYRGFELAENSMEFQLAGQIALSNTDTVDVGFFYGSASSSGDFSEFSGFFDFTREVGKWKYSAKLTLRDYTNSFFQSGADIGASVNYMINDSWDLTGFASYDTGAEGFYFETKASYYHQLNDEAYITLDTGVSAVADYYQRNGFHHAFSKLALTYNVNDAVSVSPYLSANLGIHDQARNHLAGGVYFAVSF